MIWLLKVFLFFFFINFKLTLAEKKAKKRNEMKRRYDAEEFINISRMMKITRGKKKRMNEFLIYSRHVVKR